MNQLRTLSNQQFRTASLLSLLLMLLAAAPVVAQVSPTYNYTAEGISTASTTWTDSAGASVVRTWTFNNGNGSTTTSVAPTGVSSFYNGITKAYNFSSTLEATTGSYGGSSIDGGNANASWEFWINPSNLTGTQVVYKTGGKTNGATLAIVGSEIQFNSRLNAVSPSSLIARADLAGTPSEFIQVVGVNDGNNGAVSLYINGQIANTVAGSRDWTAGTGISGLGDERNGAAGDYSGNFTGQMNQAKFYAQALTADQVAQAYAVKAGFSAVASDVLTNLNAGLDAGGNTTWDDLADNRDATFSANKSPAAVTGSNWQLLTHAYQDPAATMGDYEGIASGADTKNATFEITFRPDTLAGGATGKKTLWETGGTGKGSSFTLDGSTLQFSVISGPAVRTASIDISPYFSLGVSDAVIGGDFLHAVARVTLSTDSIELFLNGRKVNAALAGGGIFDWSGTDGAGLGRMGDTNVGGVGTPFNNDFVGQIAQFRLYGNNGTNGRLLTDAEIAGNFASVSGYGKVFENDGGNWQTGTDWTPDGVPASIDNVFIDVGLTANLNSGSGNANDLLLRGTLDWSGAATTLNAANLIIDGGTLEVSGANAQTFGNPIKLSNVMGTTNTFNVANVTGDPLSDLTISGAISGSGDLTKAGDGTLTLTGNNTYGGTTTVDGGTLKMVNSAAGNAIRGSTIAHVYVVADGATLEFNRTGGIENVNRFDLSGDGTFKTTGTMNITQTSLGSTVALGANGLFHVDTGSTFTFGGAGLGNWKSNLGDLLVNGTFNGEASAIVVDALNGNGTITIGGTISTTPDVLDGDGLTVGINNGSGTFDGTISDSTNGNQHSLAKVGNGTQTLNGDNTYTGGTQLGDGGVTTFDGTSGTQEGTLIVGHNNALGTGLITSRGTQLQAGTTGIDLPNAINVTIGGLRVGGTNDFEISGLVTLDSNRDLGHYGLDGVRVTLSGGIDTAGNSINFRGSPGKDNGEWTVNGITGGGGSVFLDGDFGQGEVNLIGTSDYTGTTTVNGGTIILDGTHTGGGQYTINSAGTLTGTGSTESAVVVNGKITGNLTTGSLTINSGGLHDPGFSPGETTVLGAYTLNAGSTLDIEILNDSGTPGVLGGHSFVNVDESTGGANDGTVTLGGDLTIDNTTGGTFNPTFAQVFTIISNDNANPVSGSFGNFTTNGELVVTINSNDLHVFYNADGDGDGILNDVVLVNATGTATQLYVNNDWTGGAVDGDLETATLEQAFFGIDAFASTNNALDTQPGYTGTLTLNGGTYAQVDLDRNGATGMTVNLVRDGDTPTNDVTIQDLQGTSGTIVTNFHTPSGFGNLIVEAGDFGGVIDGTGTLTKTTNGLLTVTGANTYSGDTTVDAGTFRQNGGTLQNANVFVNAGTFQHDDGINNVTNGTPSTPTTPHLTVANGAAYNLTGGELTFGDTLLMTQQPGNGASTMKIDGSGVFSLTGNGTLSNVTTIDVTSATGMTFSQDGGNFVIGVDGDLNTDGTATRAITTITGNFEQSTGNLLVDIFGPDSHGFNGESGGSFAINPLDSNLDSDLLHVMGDATLAGFLDVDANDFGLAPFAWYDVLLADGVINTDDLFSAGGDVSLFRVIDNPFGAGQLLQVAVPEPHSLALWGLLAAVLALYSRRHLIRVRRPSL